MMNWVFTSALGLLSLLPVMGQAERAGRRRSNRHGKVARQERGAQNRKTMKKHRKPESLNTRT